MEGFYKRSVGIGKVDFFNIVERGYVLYGTKDALSEACIVPYSRTLLKIHKWLREEDYIHLTSNVEFVLALEFMKGKL